MNEMHFKHINITINNLSHKERLKKHETLLHAQACILMQKYLALLEKHVDKANADFDTPSTPSTTPTDEED